MSRRIAALVVAAGRGSRFGGILPKQYTPLFGKMVLTRTLQSLRAIPDLGPVQVVIHPDDERFYAMAVRTIDGVLPPVPGGADRQESVRLGLEALKGENPEFVLIHDAARPFLSLATADRLILALESHKGAIAGLPVVDALWRADDAAMADEAVDRTSLWRAQTPQAFQFEPILTAHTDFAGARLADDAAVAKAAGLDVALVEGDEHCFKITTKADLERAERHILTLLPDIRTAQGFDVHSFGEGDHVWLGGVQIPHSQGLVGHSDADAGLHALTDAVLGAIGAGDIGEHFPPTDAQWKGASSDRFLEHAAKLVADKRGVIANLDLTLICQAPKIGPYRDQMRARIAQIVQISEDRVSVKATTTEKLGFTGRSEGLAALATATIRLP